MYSTKYWSTVDVTLMLVTPAAVAAMGALLDAAVVAAFAAVVAVVAAVAMLFAACVSGVVGAAAVAGAAVVPIGPDVVTGPAVVGVALLLDPQAESTSRRPVTPAVAQRIIAEAGPVKDTGEEELVDIEVVNQSNLGEYCELSVTFRPQRGGRAAFPRDRPRSPSA
jgi:hypothetical protein